MKIFSTIIILTFLSVVNFQSEKARGNYKFEVGKMSRYYNAKMQFKDSLFILTFSNGIKSIGKINYYRTQTSLDVDANTIIDFKTSEIKNDTLEFSVHDKRSLNVNYLDTSIDIGYFIRVK
jgi:hypothetical protein